jgi:hypothetical protein
MRRGKTRTLDGTAQDLAAAVRMVPPQERMDRLEFSGHAEHMEHVIHIGTYECPYCHSRVDFSTDHFRKHEGITFSNLKAPWPSNLDKARPLDSKRWESFLDFHCPGCQAPVRVIYEPGPEWAMGVHGWRVVEILESEGRQNAV